MQSPTCHREPWWELNLVECFSVQFMRKRAKKNFIFWWLMTTFRQVQSCTKIKYKISKTMMSGHSWQQFDNKIWDNNESLWSMTNFRWKDTGLRMKSKLIHWINDWYAWQQEHFLELIWEVLFSLYRKVRFLANHWTKIARTEAGIQIERHRFRRCKNLLHQPRHQTDYLNLRNNPYPEDHLRSCCECPKMSYLQVDYFYFFAKFFPYVRQFHCISFGAEFKRSF